MYSACQVREMIVDNLGPTVWKTNGPLLYSGFCTEVTFFPSGMNFGKYSAQNDVCSFDYSTNVRLIKMDTDKAFQFLYCLPHC